MCIHKLNDTKLVNFKIPVGNEHERFMGSTTILCNKNGDKIYKLLKNDNFNELDFYKSIQKGSILHKQKIIPNFLKIVRLFEIKTQSATFNDSYELLFYRRINKLDSNCNSVFALEMKNFLYNYSEPNIMDLKLGTSWIGESELDPIYNLRKSFIRVFPNASQQIEYLETLASRLSDVENNIDNRVLKQKIKYLAKSFKQQTIINSSSQSELGIRIQGLITNEVSISRQKGKELSALETMNYISEFLKLSPKLMKLAYKKVSYLKSWLYKQKKYRFIATSLVLTFDRANNEKCDIRWIDFTHALKLGDFKEKHLMNEGRYFNVKSEAFLNFLNQEL